MAFHCTVHCTDRQHFCSVLLCTKYKCSLDRIDFVCQAPVFGEKAANPTYLGTAQDDLCPFCTSGVKNPRHPRVFLLFFHILYFIFYFLWLLEGSKEKRGDWQLSRSQSINRHVSHNSAITFRCSPLVHVEDMNSWCQIPSTAPDGCDAIDLAELGRLTEQ